MRVIVDSSGWELVEAEAEPIAASHDARRARPRSGVFEIPAEVADVPAPLAEEELDGSEPLPPPSGVPRELRELADLSRLPADPRSRVA